MTFAFDPEDYTVDTLMNIASEKQLRAEYSRLRSIARKRLERLGASKYATGQTYLTYKNKFTALPQIKSVSQVAKKLADVYRFLNLDTSSIRPTATSRGAQAVEDLTVKRFQEKGFKWVSKKNLNKVTDYLEFNRSLQKGGRYDSERVLEMLETMEDRNVNISQVKKDFDFWMQNYETIDEVPEKPGKTTASWLKKQVEGLL